MAFLPPEAEELLAEIGCQLDSGQYPVVYDGGIVRPSNPSVESQPQGKENVNDAPWQKRGSPAGSRQGTSGGQRTAGRSWSPGRAAPIVDAGVRDAYRAELDDVRSAYPGAKAWLRDREVWLRTESRIFDGLTKKATLLTAIPFARGYRASAWAYWTTIVSASWIGPRHTNFPDGSICAFEPGDGTWIIGDKIVELLDLYTLWALRHLHLEVFGRWPGHQSVPIPYERLVELKDDEFCGCGQSHLRYSQCCKPGDMTLDRKKAFLEFMNLTGGHREPPIWVQPTIWGAQEPPENFMPQTNPFG